MSLNCSKILKKLVKNENDDLRLNPIPEKEWLDYYENLWTSHEHQNNQTATNDINGDSIEIKELKDVLKTLKNRKSPGLDGLNAELFKYAPDTFLTRLVDFINICWRYGHIPDD